MHKALGVWFYIGVLLAVYGVLLAGAGVYQWIHQPPTVLAGYHATFWAGVVLSVVGGKLRKDLPATLRRSHEWRPVSSNPSWAFAWTNGHHDNSLPRGGSPSAATLASGAVSKTSKKKEDTCRY